MREEKGYLVSHYDGPRLACLRIIGYITTLCMHVYQLATTLMTADLVNHPDPKVVVFAELQYRYFTCWNFGLQMLYAVTGIVCDVIYVNNYYTSNEDLPKRLRKFRDTLFSALLWPSTFLVFTLFWSLFIIDRDLVLPEFIDQVLSPLANHIIHTCIVPVVLWEVVVRPQRVPKSHFYNVLHLAVYMLTYLSSCLIYTHYERGIWLYPIFGLLHGTIYFPIGILIIGISVLSFYYLQWEIVKRVWAQDEVSKKVKSK